MVGGDPDDVGLRKTLGLIWSYRALVIVVAVIVLSYFYLSYIFTIVNKASSEGCDPSVGVQVSLLWFDELTIKCGAMSPNEVGDYFAGLVSLLATFWLIVAFIWQAMELSFQREEFRKSNAIALARVSNEDILRKLELRDALVAKLEKTAVEKLRCMSVLSGTPKLLENNSMSCLRSTAEESVELYRGAVHDDSSQQTFGELEAAHRSGIRQLAAIDAIEGDEALSESKALFD